MKTDSKRTENKQLHTEAGALQNILVWSEDRPRWQRDALRRLCTKVSLDEGDYKELLAIAKCERRVAWVLTKKHVASLDAVYKTVNLRSISEANHVNALKPGECLSFKRGKGITAIYGDNGSGKSGYARILKSACRARIKNDQVIHPDIYSPSPGTPQAKIKFSVDDQVQIADWTQEKETDSHLSAISVFDSKTASVHVDEKNEVAYNPFPLELLKQLSEACKEIQRRFKDELEELERQTPKFLENPKCGDGTKVGKLILGLSATTNPNTVETLSQLSRKEQEGYETLKSDLASNPATMVSKLNSHNTRLNRYKTQVQKLYDAVRDEALQNIQRKRTEYLKKKRAAKVAAEILFKETVLPNIGADTWRDLWEAARLYSEEDAYPEQEFPNTEDGALCVLCHQELSPEAAKRLKNFEAFVKDEAKKAEENALGKFKNALDSLVETDISGEEIFEMFSFVRDDIGNEYLAKSLRKCVLEAKRRLRRFKKNPSMDISSIPLTSVMPEEEFLEISESLSERAKLLMSEGNSEERKRSEKKLAELRKRQWLAGVKNDVLAEIERIKKREKLEGLIDQCKTTTITNKSSQLAQFLVTDALTEKFAEETEKLNLSALALELKHLETRVGSARFQISLSRKPPTGIDVSAILSEGEFRCVALAAFLAEQATANSKSAIVFDDPVSSLDHVRREQVAKRLAEESVNRQVIIFTHDLTFLFLLEEACKETGADIDYRWITRNENDIGLCKTDLPPGKQPVIKAIDSLSRYLEKTRVNYDKGDMMKWEREVDHFKKELRVLWERAVEEVVAPTVRRFSNKIDTRSLMKLTAITEEDCKKMRLRYGECSKPLHSEAASLNSGLPSSDDIEKKIDSLRNWVGDIKSRQKKIKLN